MVLITNFNNVIEELTHGYQICKTNQILLIFGWYIMVRESLYTQVESSDRGDFGT